jgi:hypothetical protein
MQSEPQSLPFANLLNEIENGTVKVPQFQRQFVWPKQKSADLLDSIFKGYPIGTFILWRTLGRPHSIRNIGDASLPATPEGDFTEYVLDGQQRITSLFAAVKGLKIDREDSTDDYSEIFIDLDSDDNGTIVVIDRGERLSGDVISVVDLVNCSFKSLFQYPERHHQRLSDLRSRISSYTFSTILVKEATIDVASEIFLRINVTAKPLSVGEIIVAKAFDAENNFGLAEQSEVRQRYANAILYAARCCRTVER